DDRRGQKRSLGRPFRTRTGQAQNNLEAAPPARKTRRAREVRQNRKRRLRGGDDVMSLTPYELNVRTWPNHCITPPAPTPPPPDFPTPLAQGVRSRNHIATNRLRSPTPPLRQILR